jgi:hypothetical protein
MFIAALFIIAKLWKQPDKWMKLGNIILSEVRQVQKAKGCMFSLTCGI